MKSSQQASRALRDAWVNEGVDRVCDLIVSMLDAAAELAADKTDVARLEAEVLDLRLRLERIEAGGAVPATSALHDLSTEEGQEAALSEGFGGLRIVRGGEFNDDEIDF